MWFIELLIKILLALTVLVLLVKVLKIDIRGLASKCWRITMEYDLNFAWCELVSHSPQWDQKYSSYVCRKCHRPLRKKNYKFLNDPTARRGDPTLQKKVKRLVESNSDEAVKRRYEKINLGK